MIPKPLPDPLRALALLAAAAACAGLANGLARTDRRLAWTGWVPPSEAAALAPAPVLPPAPAAPPPPAAPVPPAPAPAPAPARPGPEAPAARPIPPSLPLPSAKAAPAGGPPSSAPRPAPAAAPDRFAAAPDQVIRDLSGEDAWAAFQRQLPFLDARRSSDYQEGHVAGAWSVPVWEADADARITEFEARANPAPATPIIIYCSGGDCHDSRILAQRLVQLGYRNLLIYRDGWPDWIQHGRPRAQGARP